MRSGAVHVSVRGAGGRLSATMPPCPYGHERHSVLHRFSCSAATPYVHSPAARPRRRRHASVGCVLFAKGPQLPAPPPLEVAAHPCTATRVAR